MDKHVQVLSTPTCKNTTAAATTWQISLIVKHDGSQYSINSDRLNELTAIVDTVAIITYNAPKLNETVILPQTMISTSFTFLNVTPMTSGAHTFFIESPAGEISESLTCTYA
jgi:hypothetical protein